MEFVIMIKGTVTSPVFPILLISWAIFGLTSNYDSINQLSIENFTNVPSITVSSLSQWYRAFTSIFLSNYGFSEIFSNSIMLIALSLVTCKVTSYSEFLFTFIITGTVGNLLADFFMIHLSNNQVTLPSYLSTEGQNGYIVGMSTALFGLLFYTVIIYAKSTQGKAKSKIDLFILTFWLFVCLAPWSYPFFEGEAFNASDYVHMGGGLVGVLLGITVTFFKKFDQSTPSYTNN